MMGGFNWENLDGSRLMVTDFGRQPVAFTDTDTDYRLPFFIPVNAVAVHGDDGNNRPAP